MLHKICIDREQLATKPDSLKAGQISKRLTKQIATVSIAKLANMASIGHTFSPATFAEDEDLGYAPRKAAYFEQSSLLFVDIDHGNCQLADIQQIANANQLAIAFAYESFSSSIEARKWRICLALSEQCNSANSYSLMLKLAIKLFGGDSACSDICRLFYGSNKPAQLISKECNSADYLLQLANTHGLYASANKLNKFAEPEADSNWQKLYARLKPAHKKLVHFAISDVKAMLADPVGQAGSGYMAIWLSGVKLSQFSFLPANVIASYLLEGLYAQQWHTNWKHLSDAEQIVQNAISWGRANSKRPNMTY